MVGPQLAQQSLQGAVTTATTRLTEKLPTGVLAPTFFEPSKKLTQKFNFFSSSNVKKTCHGCVANLTNFLSSPGIGGSWKGSSFQLLGRTRGRRYVPLASDNHGTRGFSLCWWSVFLGYSLSRRLSFQGKNTGNE